MDTGSKIAALRKARGITQNELKAALAFGKQRVSKLETGEAHLLADEALKLARYFEVPVEWLIDENAEGEAPPPPPKPLTVDERQILELAHRCGLIAAYEVLRDSVREGFSFDTGKGKGGGGGQRR
jgi:transcriptional regulator with XRE-family HTH domain